jgi:hypothetical protein
LPGEYLLGEEGPVVYSVLVKLPAVQIKLIVKRVVVNHVAKAIFYD